MFAGLGLWVWYWDEDVLEKARRIGADYLLVKQADGVDRWGQWDTACAACRAAEIAVYPWSYCYGGPGEAEIVADSGSLVYVLDPEIEFERLSRADQRRWADALARVKRDRRMTLGAACWARPGSHPDYDYAALTQVVDVWLPMVAWQSWEPREPGHWLDVWDVAGRQPSVPWLSAAGIEGAALAGAVDLALARYGGAAIWAAHVLEEEQVAELAKLAETTAKADADFARYAPKTGTWREACVNLKGVADHALTTGRQVVAEIQSAASAAEVTWGGQ